MQHRSHPWLNTRSHSMARNEETTEEITQSLTLVEEYLADRITVTEMCNRLDLHLNRSKDDGAEDWLVTSEGPPSRSAGVERCLHTRSGTCGTADRRLLFHPGPRVE